LQQECRLGNGTDQTDADAVDLVGRKEADAFRSAENFWVVDEAATPQDTTRAKDRVLGPLSCVAALVPERGDYASIGVLSAQNTDVRFSPK
jgi:hypothetical protein